MNEKNQEPRAESKDFAIIHNTEYGQILITKEIDENTDMFLITLWFPIEQGILGKGEVKMQEKLADIAFENLRNKEVAIQNVEMIFEPLKK